MQSTLIPVETLFVFRLAFERVTKCSSRDIESFLYGCTNPLLFSAPKVFTGVTTIGVVLNGSEQSIKYFDCKSCMGLTEIDVW